MAGGDRKIGRNKRKPTNVAYKAQDRLSRNKRRNIEREAIRQSWCAKARDAGATRAISRGVRVLRRDGR